MPILIDEDRIPAHLSGKPHPRLDELRGTRTECVSIALVNNMPDPALEDTEAQFFELLDSASGDTPVHVKLYSLPGIPRTGHGEQHLGSFYFGINDLLNSRFDGVIITGTEPHHSDLLDEPYWPILTSVLDWAERSTSSTVLSCLAAHASVLYSDGIPRHRLADKQFGVFEFQKNGSHVLTKHIVETVQTPHSRWNEVREDALVACGYDVLTSSVQGGVNSFIKKKRDSLFLHFQGHPEYGTQTLLKEYRRDIKRFLRRERETYPSMPLGYFDPSVTQLLTGFRESVLSDPREEQMASFPEATVVGTLQNSWSGWATDLYRGWLQYLLSRKADTLAPATVTRMTS